jgi:hypothetical protein
LYVFAKEGLLEKGGYGWSVFLSLRLQVWQKYEPHKKHLFNIFYRLPPVLVM